MCFLPNAQCLLSLRGVSSFLWPAPPVLLWNLEWDPAGHGTVGLHPCLILLFGRSFLTPDRTALGQLSRQLSPLHYDV